ncbi:MAG: Gfo/Idh/MocA family oxidoreductase [Candidatus Bathyarchaeia archaeon]
MGKAHSHAWRDIQIFYWPPPAIPRLIAICGRTKEALLEAARRFGYEGYYTDWRAMLKDERIQIFDNAAPNNVHAEPCIAAAEAGKHVISEKPLAPTAEESKRMLEAVRRAGVKNMCAYNYRFVPAVRLAKKLIEEGFLGRIYHFRARYLQEWIMDPSFPLVWRLRKDIAGSGPLGDLGSHIIDLARFLVGEVKAVQGITTTFVKERPLPEDPSRKGAVTVEDAFEATVEFANGATGTLEATRFAGGRKNYNNFEINGEKGSIEFNLERLNELRFYRNDEPVKQIMGWHEILVTESFHPLIDNIYWPHGHIIGWEHTFINELHHFLDCVVNDKPVAPYAATFEDGWKVDVICEAILKSATSGKKIIIE